MKSLDTKKPETDADEVENPSSAQVVASIDDLLMEIIQRLPLKPLVQLKLVSKHWNSLILDPKLCFLRNRRAAGLIIEGPDGPPNSVFLDKSKSPSFRKITDLWHRHCKILHSCNGLLVCVSNPANKLPQKYYICNPTTKQCSTLPKILEVPKTTIRGIVLAFDPSKSPHYKVVCVLGFLNTKSCLLEVYSSETGSWWKCSELFTANMDFQDGVYWNGAIHWLNIVSEPRESICFNPDCDQTPKVFPMPPLPVCHNRASYYFGESCDHLHVVGANVALVGTRTWPPEAELNVYEMKRDYSEWFVKYKVKNVSDFSCHISIWNVVRGKNEDEDSFLVNVTWGTVKWYNLDKNTSETLKGVCPMVLGEKRLFQYIESLCSV